jgi:hypothetical protein
MEAIKQNERYEYVHVKPRPITALKWTEMNEDLRSAWEKYLCVWSWRAVESLIDVHNFNPSLKAISSRLGISLADTVDAVEGLEFIGAIRRLPSGGFARTTITSNLSSMEFPRNDILKGQLLVSSEFNSRILDFENVSVGNFIFSATRPRMKLLLETIEKIIHETETDKSIKPEEVFGFSFAMTSLSPVRNEKKETDNE